jgi:UDP-glucose:(heptosyl)LPS alpha-1,3-glucosyltransferase
MRRLATRLGLGGRVQFTGPLKDVRPWYGAADGFVLPTLYDPCPNAALEAFACGLPVLTTTGCGAQEWVRAGENGWVVDALDVGALAGRLDDLAGLAGDMGARRTARAVAEPLTLAAMAERLLALYRRPGIAGGGV